MAKREPYSEEVKQAAIARLLAPNAPSVLTLSKEIGISEPTLYAWKKEALTRSLGPPPPTAETPPRPVGSGEVVQLRARVAELERELAKKNADIAELALAYIRKQQGG
jgi:transposase-like protein